MKKVLFFCLGIFFTSSFLSQSSDRVNVRFLVNTTTLNTKIDSIYISGSNPKIGSWSPDKVPLKQINDSTFGCEFSFPLNESLEFKFTRGSWETEAVNSDGSVPDNHTLKVTKDTTYFVTITNWRDEFEYEIEGQITGNVEYIDSIKTRDELLPRNIIVWLPPGYYENEDKSYPVLYMHDGQNIIDPQTSSFGIDWQIDETADSLIRHKIINPIIIVGISSTDNRYTEYSENDTGYVYIDFIIEDLKPMIDKEYRTQPDRESTAIAGSSMGGLISFMAIWERPDIFSKAACLSPAFKIRLYNFVDNVESYKGTKKNIKLYIDNGGIGLEDSLQAGVNEMLKALKDQGYKEGDDLYYFKDDNALHNEAAWAQRSWRFLDFFFRKD